MPNYVIISIWDILIFCYAAVTEVSQSTEWDTRPDLFTVWWCWTNRFQQWWRWRSVHIDTVDIGTAAPNTESFLCQRGHCCCSWDAVSSALSPVADDLCYRISYVIHGQKGKKVKAINLYSALSCTPKAGGQATSNALSSLTGAAGHPGHHPQPAHTGLGSDPTVGQTAPVSSRSPPS